MSDRDVYLNGLPQPIDHESGRRLGANSKAERLVHPNIVRQLAAYTTGELEPKERQRVQTHLDGCLACQRELAESRRIYDLLRTLDTSTMQQADAGHTTTLPPSLADQMLARMVAASTDSQSDAELLMTGWPGDDDDLPGGWMPGASPLSGSSGVASLVSHDDSLHLVERASERASERLSSGRQGAARAMNPHMPVTDVNLPPAGTRIQWPFRGRAMPAIAASVALMLTSALLFGLFGVRPRPGTASASIVIPLHGGLTSISMSSPRDGWAVGSVWNGTQPSPLMLHYTSGRWTRSQDAFPGADLLGVWADASDDAWAIGVIRSATAVDSVDSTLILHYTGAHWSRIVAPTDPFEVQQVQAISPEDVWFSGLPLSPVTGTVQPHTDRVLVHFVHKTWQMIDVPDNAAYPFSATPDDQVWVAGTDGAILHFAGGTWTSQMRGAGYLTAIRMLSPQDGWAAGWAGPLPGSNPGPYQGLPLLHYDGMRWTPVPVVTPPGTSYQMNSIGVVPGAPGTVWLAGDVVPGPEEGPLLLSNATGTWHHVLTPSGLPSEGQEVWMVGPNEGWIITANPNVAPVLQHYLDGQWTIYRPGQPATH